MKKFSSVLVCVLATAMAISVTACTSKEDNKTYETIPMTTAQVLSTFPEENPQEYLVGTIFEAVNVDNFIRMEIAIHGDSTDSTTYSDEISGFDNIREAMEILLSQNYEVSRVTGVDVGSFIVKIYYTGEDGSEKKITVTQDLVLGAIEEDPTILPGDGGLVYTPVYTSLTEQEVIDKFKGICLKHQ